MDPVKDNLPLQRSQRVLDRNPCERGSRLTRWERREPMSMVANEIKTDVRKGKANLGWGTAS